VAGDDDHQCDARDVAATLALIGSIDKTFLCASRELGSAAPFGHEDLLVGQYAEPVLWPILAEWLAERS